MSVFDIDAIQTLPEPQKYFEVLCERKFGFNLTEKSRYDAEFDEKYSFILNDIICEVKRAYPNKSLYCMDLPGGHTIIVEMIINFDTWEPVMK